MKILITILLAILILATGVTIWYFSKLFPSDYDPHTYFNNAVRADNLHLPFLEEYFVKRGLKKNTILMDSQIEHRNQTYTSLIHKIIKDHHGQNIDIEQFISNYRIQNAKILPELPLVTLDNKEVNLAEQKGKVIFINFFSTYCGSCRYEISNLKNFYKKYLANNDVYIIFILNELKRNEKAKELLESNEIKNANLVLYKAGSVYDLIPAEPTT